MCALINIGILLYFAITISCIVVLTVESHRCEKRTKELDEMDREWMTYLLDAERKNQERDRLIRETMEGKDE